MNLERIKSRADKSASFSKCDRGHVGCVLFDELSGKILGSGYNKPFNEEINCETHGHIIKNGGCVRTVHAEQWIISKSAKLGLRLSGLSMYCTHSPCLICSRLIVLSGISKFIYEFEYRDIAGLQVLKQSGLLIQKL